MNQIIYQVSMVILAGFGIQGLLDLKKKSTTIGSKHVQRYLMAFGGVFILSFLILLLGKGLYLGWAAKIGQNSITAYNKALGDGFKSLILFAITAAVLLMTLKGKLKSQRLPTILIILLFLDLWGLDRKLMEFRPIGDEKAYFTETPDVTYLKTKMLNRGEKEPFRIMRIGDQRSPNWHMYHFIQNVWGYHGAKPKRYQELVDAFGIPRGPDGFLQKYLKMEGGRYSWKRPSELSPRDLTLQHQFQKLTNVRYIVSPYPLPDTTLRMVSPPDNRGGNGVFEYRDFLPRVYFPEKVITVQGKEAILGYMTQGGFDPLLTTVIEEKPPFRIVASDSNRATITAYDLHQIEMNVRVKTPALMVLSDNDYPPGWKVYVNGQEKRIVKANYAFRGVFLEPGNHNVEFQYSSKLFKIGLTLTIFTALLLVTGVIIGLRLNNRKKINEKIRISE